MLNRSISAQSWSYFFVILALFAPIFIYATLQDQSLFGIKKIELETQTNYVKKDFLTQNIKRIINGNTYWSVDLTTIAQEIKTETPWVSNVLIQKKWPNSLYIKIEDTKPLAKWGEDQWLSQDGSLFNIQPQAAYIYDLPKITATNNKNPQAIWQQYIHWNKLFKNALLYVNHLEQLNEEQWKLHISYSDHNSEHREFSIFIKREDEQALKNFVLGWADFYHKHKDNISTLQYIHIYAKQNGFAAKFARPSKV